MKLTTRRYSGGLLVEETIAEYDFTPTDPPSMPTALVTEPNVIRGPWGDLDTLKDRLP